MLTLQGFQRLTGSVTPLPAAILLLIALPCSMQAALAQENPGAAPSAATPAAGKTLSAAEIAELVAPIALYPDELLAVALPGATFPLQIVQAARHLEKSKSNPDLKPDDDWDSSVIALLNYPEVIKLMNEDLDWIWKLGEAVVNQQQDVMAAIQAFRARVDDAGNLSSNDKTVVIKETEVIKIESASPEVIYVPQYNPATVVVAAPAPYPYYYSAPYPYYYNPAATFWTGMFVGAAIAYGLDWHHDRYGYGEINVNRDTDINIGDTNINRDDVKKQFDERRSERGDRRDQRSGERGDRRAERGDRGADRGQRGSDRRADRGTRPSGGNWRDSRSSGQVGRPGTSPGAVTGRDFGSRSGLSGGGTRLGDRSGFGSNRGSYGSNRGSLGSNRGSYGSGRSSLGSNRGSYGSGRSSLGSNRGSFGSNRSSLGGYGSNRGSFGGYQRGSSSRMSSQRGFSSRSGMSRSSRGFSGSGRSRGGFSGRGRR